MLEMINFVFPISTFMVSSSRWGSDITSGDDGCLEKGIDSLMKTSNPPLCPWGRSLRIICSADGAGVGEGGGGVDFWVFEAEQESHVQYLFLRHCAAFKSPEHFAFTHPGHLVHR